MANPSSPKVAAAHVNMMTDTIIKNMTIDGLRSIMRSLLAAQPELTATFEAETRKYIQEFALPTIAQAPSVADTQRLDATQRTIRCMVGCGLCYEALPLAQSLAEKALELSLRGSEDERAQAAARLASIDGDIVQAVTAVQKTLMAPSGTRRLTDEELARVRDLHQVLVRGQQSDPRPSIEYPYNRALAATSSLLKDTAGTPCEPILGLEEAGGAPPVSPEMFSLNGRELPRIFSGLWQLSSPAWGSAPTSKIVSQFLKHVQGGFTAFDMADHYGDAEIVFVSGVESRPYELSRPLANRPSLGPILFGIPSQGCTFRRHEILRVPPSKSHAGSHSSQHSREV